MSDDRKKRGHKDKVPTKSAIESLVVEEIEVVAVGAGVGLNEKEQRRLQRRGAWLRQWLTLRRTLAMTALALLAVAGTAATRGFWPVDETRFLSVAWEMWSGGDRLVPRVNGVPTPLAPLFFWAVHAGWTVFGVNDWWPRFLPGLLMVVSLFVLVRIAWFLWPGDEPWQRRIPYAMLGSLYWVASATLFTPDFLTVLMVLLALHALLWMWRTRDQRVWLLLAVWMGLGLLASGTLFLIYVFPVAMLAPIWTRGTPTMKWKYWYLDIFKALFIGVVIFAAWLIPAMARAKAGAVPVSLTPVVSAPFATHALDLYDGARPWWWLLALLPVLGFPWALWPLPWLRFWHIRRDAISNGLAFCMVWGVVTIALFLISPMRQPQLLLPMVPALLLVLGWLVLDDRHEGHDHSHLASTMIFPFFLLGSLLAVLPKLPRVPYAPEFLWQLSPLVGVAIIFAGIIVGFLPLPSLERRVTNMAVMVCVISTLALLAMGWQFNENRDPGPAAAAVARIQQQGKPVAAVGPYAGQLQYAGRLRKPLDVLTPEEAEPWMITHPDGAIMTLTGTWQPSGSASVTPLYDQPFGDGRIVIWPVGPLAAKVMPAVPAANPSPP